MYIAYVVVILLSIKQTQSLCGRRLVNHFFESRISLGFTTQPGDWPWHAAIYKSTNKHFDFYCGGSLINRNIILTAGHCVYEDGVTFGPELFSVELGKYNLRMTASTQRNFKVDKVALHPQYNETHYYHDIALLRLSTLVTFTKYIQPICLWDDRRSSSSSIVNRVGIAIGWGRTANGPLADTLQAAEMPVVPYEECRKYDFFLSGGNFCAGYKNGTNICKGDSGGSISFLYHGRYYIRGITSYYKVNERFVGCNPEGYAAFTDVVKYFPWIRYAIGVRRRILNTIPRYENRENTWIWS